MNMIIVSQLPSMRWRVWALPPLWVGIFITAHIYDFYHQGDPFRRELIPFVCVEILILAITALPLLLRTQRVEGSAKGVTVHFYVGRPVNYEWTDLSRIDLFEDTTRLGDTKILRLIPRRGRRVVVTSKLSNFDQFARSVQSASQMPINRTQRLLYRGVH